MPDYVELHCHSCYSLREGASTPAELLHRAAELGYDTLALTDHDGLYGAMEFYQEARQRGIRPIIGAEVTLSNGYHLTLLAESQAGYANLCRLISHGLGTPLGPEWGGKPALAPLPLSGRNPRPRHRRRASAAKPSPTPPVSAAKRVHPRE